MFLKYLYTNKINLKNCERYANRIYTIDEWPVRPYSKRSWPWPTPPEISPVSALNRLAEWMRYNDRLTRELGDTGYRPRQRVFTSLQVELIFRYLRSSLRGDTATRRYRRAAMPVLASDNASTGVGLRR